MDIAAEVDATGATVASAAAGDHAAFARIVAKHHEDMVRVAYLISHDVDIANDATQSAWSIVWRKLGTLKAESSLRPWLVSVAANEARQMLRRRKRHSVREIELDSVSGLQVSSTTAFDDNVDLLNALSQLTPEDRAIVAMRYALGLTSEEIGRATGLSAPGVRSRLQRSVARLRKELGDD